MTSGKATRRRRGAPPAAWVELGEWKRRALSAEKRADAFLDVLNVIVQAAGGNLLVAHEAMLRLDLSKRREVVAEQTPNGLLIRFDAADVISILEAQGAAEPSVGPPTLLVGPDGRPVH
jgi:hypothetical protein